MGRRAGDDEISPSRRSLRAPVSLHGQSSTKTPLRRRETCLANKTPTIRRLGREQESGGGGGE